MRGFELDLEEGKRFWKGMLVKAQIRKMRACLESLKYLSYLKLTVSREMLGKDLGVIK
jgi:hypothetical protein